MATPYKDWLQYMIGVRQMDVDRLSRRTGVDAGYVGKLLSGEIAQPSKNMLYKIGKGLGVDEPSMDKVLEALDIHVDLGKFKNACGNPCCFWNAPID